jgi:hypothetical protein
MRSALERWDSYPEAGKTRFRISVSGAAQRKLLDNLVPAKQEISALSVEGALLQLL